MAPVCLRYPGHLSVSHLYISCRLPSLNPGPPLSPKLTFVCNAQQTSRAVEASRKEKLRQEQEAERLLRAHHAMVEREAGEADLERSRRIIQVVHVDLQDSSAYARVRVRICCAG